jgi:hypothetical protein
MPHYLFVQQIAPELLMTLLLLLFVYGLVRQWPWWLQSAIFAALLLAKGTFLFVPLLLYAVQALYKRSWRSLQMLCLVYIGCLILISPWIVRNYRHFHQVIISSIGIGNVLWPGNNLATNGYWRGNHDPIWFTVTHKYPEVEGNHDPIWFTVTHKYPEVEADKVLTSMAITSMRAHPLATAKLWLKKAGRYWFLPIGYETLMNKNKVLGYLWFFWYWLFLSCAVYGLGISLRQLLSGYILVLIGYLWALHIILYAIPRYHYSLIPLLCITAGSGAVALYERYAKKY